MQNTIGFFFGDGGGIITCYLVLTLFEDSDTLSLLLDSVLVTLCIKMIDYCVGMVE